MERVIKNVLDTNGDLSIVESKKNSSAGYWHYADSFSYNAAGAVTSLQLGNGKWESTQFNSRLQPTEIALGTTQAATDKLKLDYSYGDWNGSSIDPTKNNGNIVQQVITTPTVGAYSGFVATQKYYYDALNRIDDSNEVIGSTTTWRQDFTYDRYGNRNFVEANTAFAGFDKLCNSNTELCSTLRKKLNPGINGGNNNRINSGQDYSFDAAGNTNFDAALRKFTYDAENKQTKVESTNSSQVVTGTVGEYSYDGDGKRVKKKVGDEVTIFVYDAGGKQIAEYSTTVANSTDAKVNYLTNDHLGSPRINTDRDGQVIARHDYHPFGEEIATSQRSAHPEYPGDTVRKQFTGYERDNETGLNYAKARMHESVFGRFTTPDPLLASAEIANPQTWNRYCYVGNNPLNRVDPSGLTWATYKVGKVTHLHWFAGDAPSTYNGHAVTVYTGPMTVTTTTGPGRLSNDGHWSRINATAYANPSPGARPSSPVRSSSHGNSVNFSMIRSIANHTEHVPEFLGVLSATSIAFGTVGGLLPAAASSAFATPEGAAVFWSGYPEAQVAATEYAVANGGQTISMTTGGRFLSVADRFIRPVSEASIEFLWNHGSRYFAAGSSGAVNVFLKMQVDPERAWRTIEEPHLMQWGQTIQEHIVH